MDNDIISCVSHKGVLGIIFQDGHLLGAETVLHVENDVEITIDVFGFSSVSELKDMWRKQVDLKISENPTFSDLFKKIEEKEKRGYI